MLSDFSKFHHFPELSQSFTGRSSVENENRDKPIVPACRSRPVVSAKTIHIDFILIVCMKSMFLQAIVCENLEKSSCFSAGDAYFSP